MHEKDELSEMTAWLSFDLATLKSGRSIKYKAQGPLYAASFALSAKQTADSLVLSGAGRAKILFKSWSLQLESHLEFDEQESLRAHRYLERSDKGERSHSLVTEAASKQRTFDPATLLWTLGPLMKERKLTYFAQLFAGNKRRLLKLDRRGPSSGLVTDYVASLITLDAPTDSLEHAKGASWQNAAEFDLSHESQKEVISRLVYRVPAVGRVELTLDESGC